MRLERVIIASAVLFIACGDTTEPEGNASGSVSFNFAGAGGGTFNASGALPKITRPSPGATAWAAGNSADGSVSVVGTLPRSSTTWNQVTINTAATVGTVTIGDPNCTIAACIAQVLLVFDYNPAESTLAFRCMLDAGTVAVTSIDSGHATGTFSGTGKCFNQSDVTSSITVTNGVFDVGLTKAELP
jgi:hypothetical protein